MTDHEEEPAVEPEIEQPEAEDAQPDEGQVELEQEARKYGWRAQEEYDNPPEGWMEAERFLDHPKTKVKVLRDENRRREADAKSLREQLDRITSLTKAQMESVQRQERERYDARVAELQRAKLEAIQEADPERVTEIERAERAIPRPHQAQQHPDAEVEAYLQSDAGKAWATDQEMVRAGYAAVEAHPEVKALPALRQYQWVERKLREFYPDRFASPPAPEPPAKPRQRVQGASMASATPASKGVRDLPADAKKQGQEYVEMGFIKSLEDYAKSYWEQS